jgi:cell wall-associated NlpC family hydrolase
MNQLHWASALIGQSYQRGASGPDTFDCWGLVRWVFENVHGIQMPVIAVGQDDNMVAIRQAVDDSGWRPTDEIEPAENDIVLMTGLEGKHVGVMVRANGSLLLLHCLEQRGVCAEPLRDLSRWGFRDFTFWRHA